MIVVGFSIDGFNEDFVGRVNIICVVCRVGRKFTSNYFLLVKNCIDGKIINYVGTPHTTTVIAEPTIR